MQTHREVRREAWHAGRTGVTERLFGRYFLYLMKKLPWGKSIPLELPSRRRRRCGGVLPGSCPAGPRCWALGRDPGTRRSFSRAPNYAQKGARAPRGAAFLAGREFPKAKGLFGTRKGGQACVLCHDMPIAPYLRNELLPTDTTHFALSGEQLLNRFKTRQATANKKGGRTAPASRFSFKGFPFGRAQPCQCGREG